MPEYALCYLLHVLSSQPSFSLDAVTLRACAKYITSFLGKQRLLWRGRGRFVQECVVVDAVLTSHNHNFAFIIALLTCLKSSIPLSGSDRVPPPEHLYALSDLTMIILKRKYQHQVWQYSSTLDALTFLF